MYARAAPCAHYVWAAGRACVRARRVSLIRTGWAGAGPDVRERAQQALVARLDAYIASPARADGVVARRLCLALACAAAATAGGAVGAFVDNALDLAPDRPSEAGIAVALELVSSLAGEALQRPHAARAIVADELGARLGALLPLLGAVAGMGGASGPYAPLGPLTPDALRCLRALVRAGAGLPRISRESPELLRCLYGALRYARAAVCISHMLRARGGMHFPYAAALWTHTRAQVRGRLRARHGRGRA